MFAKHILAIDLDINKWHVTIGTIDTATNQVILDHVGTYSNIPDLKAKLAKYSVSKTVYSISNQYSVSFVTNPLTNLTLDAERNSRRIGTNQNVDYFNLGSSSILVALPENNVTDIAAYHEALGLRQPFAINSTDVELGYLLKRNYQHHQNLTIAVINFQQQHIGISIYQFGSLKHITWIDLDDVADNVNAGNETTTATATPTPPTSTIVATKQTQLNTVEFVAEKPVGSSNVGNSNNTNNTNNSNNINTNNAIRPTNNDLIAKVVKSLVSAIRHCDPTSIDINETEQFTFHYNLVLVAGSVPNDFVLNVRVKGASEKLKISDVEFIEPLRLRSINISKLPDDERTTLERNAHQFAIPISSITMAAENLGVNLALSTSDYKNNKLDKKVPINFEIKVNENVFTKLAMSAVANAKLIVPSLVSQKYLLLVATLTCLIIAGYRYYTYNNEIAAIQNDYTSEKNREVLLLAVKTKYEDLQRKNKSKNDLISSIKNIQKTQMLVPTIMSDIQNLSYQTTFRGLITISELDIAGVDIKVAGKALDKFRVASFASELQSANYEDVIPAKYSAIDNTQGTYEIVTKYTGNIPKNPVLLPKQSPVQLMNINQVNQK